MHAHIQSPATRCNEVILFTVSTKNLGTTTFTKGTLWLENDSSIVSTEFVDKPDTLIPLHQYGWFYENLPPSHTIAKKIRLTIPLPIWCKDADGDGLGNPNQTVEACEQPEGYVSDCNDPGNVIGIVEQSVNDLINVYPNPCVGIFKIDIDSANFSKAPLVYMN